MEITNTIVNLFTPAGFVGVLELLFIVIQIIYVLYAFIVTRQVHLMNKSFRTPMAAVFTTLAFFHMIGAIASVLITILLS